MKILVVVFTLALGLFGFNSIKNVNAIEGKVIKAYTQKGYGRMANEWLFMDIKGKDGIILDVVIVEDFNLKEKR